MAVLWADNFQSYGTTAARMLDGIYAQIGNNLNGGDAVTLVVDPNPTDTGNVVRMPGSAAANSSLWPRLRFVYPGGARVTIGFSFRLYLQSLPSSDSLSFRWELKNSANLTQLRFRVTTTGGLVIERSDGTVLATSAGPVLTSAAWNHIEGRATIDPSTGAFEVRINGLPIASLTASGVNTRSQSVSETSQFEFSQSGGNPGSLPVFLKDFIIWDTSGAQNTDFLGTCAVITLRPSSDDVFTWGTSSGSTGFSLINEASPNDAGFISAGDPPPAPSEFGLTNLPADIVSVRALIPVSRSRKIDGGDGNLQLGLKGTLVDLGDDKPVTTAFTYRWDVSELSPDTAAPWTPVEVDNVKLQVNRTL